jgi:hypothetical protein
MGHKLPLKARPRTLTGVVTLTLLLLASSFIASPASASPVTPVTPPGIQAPTAAQIAQVDLAVQSVSV